VGCVGALLGHLQTKYDGGLPLAYIRISKLQSFMMVSRDVLNSLLIIEDDRHPNMHTQAKSKEGMSLFKLLDRTKSAGGREMLKQWVTCPLQNLSEINERLEAVSFLVSPTRSDAVNAMRQALCKIKSIRAICSRVQTELLAADLEHLAQLAYAVVKLYHIVSSLGPAPALLREFLSVDHQSFGLLSSLIIDTVDFDTSRQEERVVVASGVSEKVDHLRGKFESLLHILTQASYDMEQAVGVAVVAVYFPQLGFLTSIDIAHLGNPAVSSRVAGWTLKFQTDKQNYYKNEITQALDRSPGDIFSLVVVDAEAEVCLELQHKVCCHVQEIAHAVDLASQIDCLQSLATAAKSNGYQVPRFNEEGCIHICQGRHPVLESIASATPFIPNDVHLAGHTCTHSNTPQRKTTKAIVLLGPNASGKTILLKQTALIVHMAHIGCPVPAASATIGLVDRIFVTGKASESLAQKTSALSADLRLVSSMLSESTSRSLVLLDEFGRGTNPIDGVSLLCGVLASLIQRMDSQPAFIAATHFHGKRCA
ncbi:hypothetical protein GQ54DRAFT_264213, partial [Martensiomyces pterosporus]